MTPEQLKAEKIKEAWGDKWMQIYSKIDENGWVWSDASQCIIDNTFERRYFDYNSTHFEIRPVSLRGIEDNNGWHHITDKESLPEPRNHYDFISRKTGNRVKDYLPPIDSKEDKINLDFILEQYSHWRTIHEIPGPIY